MELNSDSINRTKFQVISNDDLLIQEVIQSYNDRYGTDFRVDNFIYDEVVFAELSVSKFTLYDIFKLGYQFGEFAAFKRNNGEIDW